MSDAPDTSPSDLNALRAHVERCEGSRGRLFAARCAVESALGFMASRLVTTAVVVAVVLGLGSLLV